MPSGTRPASKFRWSGSTTSCALTVGIWTGILIAPSGKECSSTGDRMPKGEKGTAKPYRRGQIWWIKYSVPGETKPRRESSGSVNKNDALKLLNQRRAEVDRRQVSST